MKKDKLVSGELSLRHGADNKNVILSDAQARVKNLQVRWNQRFFGLRPQSDITNSFSRVRVSLNAVLIIILFFALGLFQPAHAIGPGAGGSKIRVSDERIGPYILLVATSPLPVTPGQMNVWVRVTDAATDQLRRDAVVTIEATPRGDGQTLTAQATHQNAGNDYDYVAHLEVDQTGQWDVTIFVQDEPGDIQTAFTETVSRGLSATVLIAVAVPFVILAVAVGVFLWRRSAHSA